MPTDSNVPERPGEPVNVPKATTDAAEALRNGPIGALVIASIAVGILLIS